VQQVLDAITGAAAFVRNDRLDILGDNELGFALYSEMLVGPARPVNTARFVKHFRLLGSWDGDARPRARHARGRADLTPRCQPSVAGAAAYSSSVT
jgi:hypothetical protein